MPVCVNEAISGPSFKILWLFCESLSYGNRTKEGGSIVGGGGGYKIEGRVRMLKWGKFTISWGWDHASLLARLSEEINWVRRQWCDKNTSL